MSENDTLNDILDKLNEINSKMDKLLQDTNRDAGDKQNETILSKSMDVMTLISLPEHLRTTATTLLRLEQATADEISEITGKERAVESNYLNQLVKLGYVTKFRKGKRIYFRFHENIN
ncbi:MAG: helix-turn-helix domain-containing protein [Methanohalobium sp.]|uniref:helix-turn-helix domain-containing protein n=1 Tax=Methanohalobium sp. TaxID=2837493 RepID=UPI00397E13D3